MSKHLFRGENRAPQFTRRRSDISRTQDRGKHSDTRCACVEDGTRIVRGDATDADHRLSCLLNAPPERTDSERITGVRFAGCSEHGADAEVVRRRPGTIVGRPWRVRDHEIGAEPLADICRRNVRDANVDAVRLSQQCDVEPIVHEEQRVMLSAQIS